MKTPVEGSVPMKPKTLPEVGKRIEVSWADCYTFDSWTLVDVLLTKTMPVIKSTGYFLGVTGDHCWVVASGLQVMGTEIYGGATWFIPKVMIRSWEATE
jgi:hypothetical protein